MYFVRYCLFSALLLCASVLTLHAQWMKRASIPVGGTDAGFAFSIGDKVYYGGGSAITKGFWEYDPAADKWSAKANFPIVKIYRCFGVSFSIGGKGYIALGQSDTTAGGQASVTSDLWAYDPVGDKWTKQPDFPGAARDGAMAFVINGIAYVGGGVDANYQYLSDFYSYDPSKQVWMQLGDLPSGPIGFPMAFSVGGKGYLVGGGQGAEQTKGWSYNPADDTWAAIAPFPGAARETGVGFSIDTLGYAGLGEANYNKSFSDIYSYNPTKDAWTKVTPGFPYTLGVGWPVSAVAGNTAYMGTGADQNFSFKNFWYSYAPNAPQPLTAPTLTAPANSAMITDTAIDFIWSAVPTATSYHLEIAPNLAFSGPLFEDHVTVPSAHVQKGPSGTFYWRVAATGANGDGAWSQVRSFSEAEASVDDARTENTSAVFPNPVHHTLILALRGTIAIFDALGREVLTAKNASSINVSDLKSGSYHYQLCTSEGVSEGRFIKD